MNRLIGLWGLLLACLSTSAQNLVVNPSFEQYSQCIRTDIPGQFLASLNPADRITIASWGTGAAGWYAPYSEANSALSTSSYHVLDCNRIWAGARGNNTPWFLPRTGQGYIILNTYEYLAPFPLVTRESGQSYAQAELTTPLRAGCTYRVSFYVRLAWGWEFNGYSLPPIATDNIGAYFSVQAPMQYRSIPIILATPQVSSPPGVVLTDTVNYTRVSGTFVAQGGERYLTLGNFRPDAQTTTRQLWANSRWGGSARYAIDDVSVEAVPPAGLALELGPDQWLGACAGTGPTPLTAQPGFQGYRWNTGQTTASIQVSQPGRYVVTADFGCGLVKDSVEVRRYDPRLTPLLGLPPLELCPGTASPVAARPGFADYRWADGPTGPTRSLTAPGRYRLTARTADGCLVRDSLTVTLAAAATLPRLPADTLVCAEALPLRLPIPAAPPGVRYAWSAPGATATALPVPAAGTYVLTATTSCLTLTRTATVRVQTRDCNQLTDIPNILTPNGDRRNDVFSVPGLVPGVWRLEVYSRWGRAVYDRPGYTNGTWGADGLAAGVYYYRLSRPGHQFKGWLEVVR